MNKRTLVLRTILAVVVGEVSLIVLTTIAQEVLFPGIRYHDSPRFDLVFGGLATILAAVFAGMLASVVISHSKIVPIAMSTLVLVETSALVLLDKTTDPLWFDILAGTALIIGIWTGYFWGSRMQRMR